MKSRFILLSAFAALAGPAFAQDSPVPPSAEDFMSSIEQAWNEFSDSDEVVGTLQFRQTIANRRLTKMLEETGLRPYRLHFVTGEEIGMREVPREAANTGLLATLPSKVEQASTRGKREIRVRALELQDPNSPEEEARADALIDANDRIDLTISNIRNGKPLVYGMSVIGPRSAFDTAAEYKPLRLEVVPGFQIGDAWRTLDPVKPPKPGNRTGQKRTKEERDSKLDDLRKMK